MGYECGHRSKCDCSDDCKNGLFEHDVYFMGLCPDCENKKDKPKMEWTKWTEGDKEPRGWVLVWGSEMECENSKTNRIYTAYRDYDQWCTAYGEPIEDVTHWAELPEGPK